MTAQEIEKGFQEIWQLFRETDRKFKETDRKFKETDRKLERTEEMVANLTGKWGRFVEGLVVPAIIRLFRDRGITLEKVYQRVHAEKNGTFMEVDILAIDEEYAVLVEVKSTLGVEDVQAHLNRLEKFKTVFTEYENRKVVGAVAGIVIDERADRFAYKKGLFVIGQRGDTVAILNDENFRPRMW